MDSSPAAPCRLQVFLAQEAPLGVVLRRGPSDWFRLSLWHTDTDTFEHGQWFRGRVYDRRSDLSPDGRLFVSFAGKPGGGRSMAAPAGETAADTWIAVSRPPWFTALALWFIGGTYCTGGYFLDNSTLFPGWSTAPDQGTLPRWLRLAEQPPHLDPGYNWTDRTVHHNRLLRLGWRSVRHVNASTGVLVSEPEVWEHDHPSEEMTLIYTDAGYDPTVYGGPHVVDYAVRVGSPHSSQQGLLMPLPGATWAGWDQRGRLVLAHHGRLGHWQPGAPAKGGRVLEIADFNGQQPDPQPSPPKARQWPAAPKTRSRR